MTVLYILDYGTVGGATHSFIEMVMAMKSYGVRPIVCLGKKTDIVDLLNKEGIKYVYLGHRTVLEPFSRKGFYWPCRLFIVLLRYWLKELIALYRLRKVDLSSIDLIHTNSARNDIGCFINKKRGIPHIMHIREFADADFDCIPLRHNYIKLYDNYTSVFISISEAVRQHWTKKGITKEIKTIYNGINCNDITVSSDESKKVLFKMFIAGGVFPTKGQHLIIEAMGLLPESIRRNVTLDVAGWFDENYVVQMQKYAAARGYNQQIKFLGSINNVHERLGEYQIGLMCSKSEGFGRSTAEYMHAQLGVIASDSGANPELIEDGVTGLLFQSGDAHSLKECILKMYSDRDFLIRVSHAARKKAQALYTQEKNAANIYQLYQHFI